MCAASVSRQRRRFGPACMRQPAFLSPPWSEEELTHRWGRESAACQSQREINQAKMSAEADTAIALGVVHRPLPCQAALVHPLRLTACAMEIQSSMVSRMCLRSNSSWSGCHSISESNVDDTCNGQQWATGVQRRQGDSVSLLRQLSKARVIAQATPQVITPHGATQCDWCALERTFQMVCCAGSL